MSTTHSTSMSRESTDGDSLGEPSESTRLLHDEERDGISPPPAAKGPTPLPKAQLGTLVVVRSVDPIAYSQIFPFINQLLADLRIAKPEQVGLYSGLIESAYSLAQVFSVYQWGRLSDIVGRRPVLIFGLLSIAVTTIAFGLSTSLVTILASRFLGGLVAGNIAVLHSILVEITDETNQNMAVSIYSLSWSTGAVIGPLIGGTFENAATRYPKYFSWHIFVDHPYLLPCIITAGCALLGACLGYCIIEETLPSKRKDATSAVSGNEQRSPSNGGSAGPGLTDAKALLAIPALRALILSGLALSFLASAFDVVFTLFCYTPVDAGGLGLQPSTIGNFLAFGGTFAVLLRLVVMPYILRQFDYVATYNTCMYLWPAVFAFLPLFNMLARPPAESELSPGFGAGVWIGLALVLALSKVATIPYSITVLLIKRHVPNVQSASSSVSPSYGTRDGSGLRSSPASAPGPGSSTLGQSNGLVQFAMCLGRAVGPIVVSTLFTTLNGSSTSWARRWGVGPWAWSVVMVCFAMVGARVTKGMR
ncbi:major facilitator superfamily domain-containing protein [Chiua virens]|nr:major facilitator superfamily domain-containing protein [Chiua virens]